MTSSVPPVLAARKLVVVDVEGNGQSPPEIIELAALPIDAEVTQASMRSWLIRPQKPILPMVTKKVHGITNADVAECPPWSDVALEIESLLDGRVLVAHGAHVEHRVLGAHLPGWLPPMVLDTLRLAKYVWPGLSSYALDKLVAHADLDLTDVAAHRHRATYDTWCAWKLLCALVDDGDIDWTRLINVGALPGSVRRAEPEGLW